MGNKKGSLNDLRDFLKKLPPGRDIVNSCV